MCLWHLGHRERTDTIGARGTAPGHRRASGAVTPGGYVVATMTHDNEALRRTPAQQRAWTHLLAADDARSTRPPTDPQLAEQLRDHVRSRLRTSLQTVPAAETVWLSKAALTALVCDGRYIDHREQPFSWSVATVAGQLAHAAIAVDLAGGRRRPVDLVADHAWAQIVARNSSAGAFVAALPGVDADALRAETISRCQAFRDCFPHLPSWMHARTEVPLTWRLSAQVVVKGIPDLVVGRPDPERRLVQLIELKTGARRSEHRDDVALYALLATVKYGVAPFRVATYYLDEADWDTADVTPALLEHAAARLIAKVTRAITLIVAPPVPEDLMLRRTAACSWCSRASTCPLTADRRPELVAA